MGLKTYLNRNPDHAFKVEEHLHTILKKKYENLNCELIALGGLEFSYYQNFKGVTTTYTDTTTSVLYKPEETIKAIYLALHIAQMFIKVEEGQVSYASSISHNNLTITSIPNNELFSKKIETNMGLI